MHNTIYLLLIFLILFIYTFPGSQWTGSLCQEMLSNSFQILLLCSTVSMERIGLESHEVK